MILQLAKNVVLLFRRFSTNVQWFHRKNKYLNFALYAILSTIELIDVVSNFDPENSIRRAGRIKGSQMHTAGSQITVSRQ